MAAARPATLAGIHHLKLPVSDLQASLDWYGQTLGAQHLDDFDHYDDGGTRYAAIIAIPGVETPIELRWAPLAASRIEGYDPIGFAVKGTEEMERWAEHVSALGVENSGVLSGPAGHMLVLADPDGAFIRLLELPSGGVEETAVPTDRDPEPPGPWSFPPSMSHPTEERDR